MYSSARKKKDLHNIERAYNIRTWKRHSSDSVSVNLWVKEMGKKKGNPVLLYKQQGQILADIGVSIGLVLHWLFKHHYRLKYCKTVVATKLSVWMPHMVLMDIILN